MMRMVDIVHECLRTVLSQTGITIDATMGNGNDTLFLSKHSTRVFAFDIQKEAVETTKEKLTDHGVSNVHLIQDSHENMAVYVSGDVEAIIFNFGYLPGNDSSITTKANSSLRAIKTGLKLLKPGGFMALTFYPGHSEGKRECDIIEPYLQILSNELYQVFKHQLINKENTPYSIFIKKTRSEYDA